MNQTVQKHDPFLLLSLSLTALCLVLVCGCKPPIIVSQDQADAKDAKAKEVLPSYYADPPDIKEYLTKKPSTKQDPAKKQAAKKNEKNAAKKPVIDPTKWGSLQGRFVVEGKAPNPRRLVIPANAGCGKGPFWDNSFLVGKKGGLANVAIYAAVGPKNYKAPIAPIHPDYQKRIGKNVEIDNRGCRFVPHVQKLWTKEKLLFNNSDKIAHACTFSAFGSPGFSATLPAGGKIQKEIKFSEKICATVKCGIHPWMKSLIVIRPDPYVDISAADGTFIIKNLPVGKHFFRLRHERLGYLMQTKIGGKEYKKMKSGVYQFEIKTGMNDLGDITLDLSAEFYKKKL